VSAARRRLLFSFALALCTGLAYFGLLDALTSVRRPMAMVHIVRHIEPMPVRTTVCPARAKPIVKATFVKPVPLPPPPPLELKYGPDVTVFYDFEARDDFDLPELLWSESAVF
jgi:hypothetical protein